MLASHTKHYVNGNDMFANYPQGYEQVLLGMGCFWGAERIFWKLPGVYVTSVGYAGGHHPAPDYKLACSGTTGHAEVIHVVFDPAVISFQEILKVFFENHDPTQGDRQGNDRGPQYRSTVYTYNETHLSHAKEAAIRYARAYGRAVTTQIAPADIYHPAEDYHQQYLAKNPRGYCMHGPTGIVCPLPDNEIEAQVVS